jgi:surfeit locus 1 family protein
VTASRGKRRFLLLLCLFGFILFASLGVWQIERRAWKLDLIARVDARIHAPPIAAPRNFDALGDEYRRVRATGIYLHDRTTLVDALTERGAGVWVVTPLRTASGILLVNRGFVPPERKGSYSRPAGPVVVTGLMRQSEPNGRFLRPNNPANERWYSRDVTAIASARGLRNVAPYFIDADAAANPDGYPVGGMTVVTFRNMHLAYALTWFALAGLCIAGLVIVRRQHGDGQ